MRKIFALGLMLVTGLMFVPAASAHDVGNGVVCNAYDHYGPVTIGYNCYTCAKVGYYDEYGTYHYHCYYNTQVYYLAPCVFFNGITDCAV